MQNYGIIGYPLSHSFSPIIHNMAFKSLGINAEYSKIEIKEENFERHVLSLKKGNWQGFNITIPYKEKIIPFLDNIDPISKKIGAINTIKVEEDGGWTGFNTDYIGFLKPIQSHLEKIKSCLIIGAGGAARAAAYGLSAKTKIEKMLITNRTIKRGQILVDQIKTFTKTNCLFIDLTKLKNEKEKVDLIINTTSVGMGAQKDKIPVNPIPFSHKNTIVYDLIYNPVQTQFLKAADSAGLNTINGLPMLIWQAEASFNIWTGKHFTSALVNQLFERM